MNTIWSLQYCQLIGGNLDGVVFTHPAPKDIFPSSQFGRPGHPEDLQRPHRAVGYRRIDVLPMLPPSLGKWNVYLAQDSSVRTDIEINEKVRSYRETTRSIMETRETSWCHFLKLNPGEMLMMTSLLGTIESSVVWYAIVDQGSTHRGRLRRTVRHMKHAESNELIVVFDEADVLVKSYHYIA